MSDKSSVPKASGSEIIFLMMLVSPLLVLSKYVSWSKSLRENQLTVLGHILTLPAVGISIAGRLLVNIFSGINTGYVQFKQSFTRYLANLKNGESSLLVKNKVNKDK